MELNCFTEKSKITDLKIKLEILAKYHQQLPAKDLFSHRIRTFNLSINIFLNNLKNFNAITILILTKFLKNKFKQSHSPHPFLTVQHLNLLLVIIVAVCWGEGTYLPHLNINVFMLFLQSAIKSAHCLLLCLFIRARCALSISEKKMSVINSFSFFFIVV